MPQPSEPPPAAQPPAAEATPTGPAPAVSGPVAAPADKLPSQDAPAEAAAPAASEIAPPAPLDTASTTPSPAVAEAPEATPPATAAPPSPPAGISPEAAAELIARGDQLLRLSDATSARLAYGYAAGRGSAPAMRAMGESYDPLILPSFAVRGVTPDSARAMEWYDRAIAAGDSDAKRRRDNLAAMLGKK
jgi:TPR repeat protein